MKRFNVKDLGRTFANIKAPVAVSCQAAGSVTTPNCHRNESRPH
jgi:hypothetical protein